MLSLLFSGNLYAEWKHIGQTKNYILYFDVSSVKQYGLFTSAWVMKNYHTVQYIPESGQFISTKNLEVYKCNYNLIATKSFVAYSDLDAKGNIIANEKFSDYFENLDFRDIPPGSMADVSYTLACSQ
jgi:hypothetical protein